MVQATIDQIGEALGNEVTDWRERQIEALNDVRFPQIESGDDSSYLKTMAWLNFGVDATKSLFPNSTLASIIEAAGSAKYSVPVFILGMAQDGFEILYDEIIANHNRLLRTRFETLRDDFVRRVQSTSRGFRDSPYGRNCIEQIHRYLGNRQFRDGNQVNALCRRLIHAANLVETDQAAIRQLTNEGFSGLCETIQRIYLGMHRGPGNNELWYAADSTRSMWGLTSRTGPRYELVRRDSRQDWILAHAWQMRANHVDEPWWTDRPDRTYVVRVNSASNPMHLAETYRGQALDLAAAERRMEAEE